MPGPTGPARIYYNDVWKSADGAPWALRAGAVVVVKDDYMVLPGGEAGFLCDPLPSCELPYFNDVWRYALPTP